MKKIAIVGTVGIPANYGGFETLAEQLTKRLAHSFKFYVYCSKNSYIKRPRDINGIKLIYLNFKANGYQSFLYDIFSIYHASKFADIILILGVSGCIYLPIITKLSRKKYIVNIDGIEWRREKWNLLSKTILKYSEMLAVKYADNIISDNQEIQKYILDDYGAKSVFIPYGGNHAGSSKLSTEVNNLYPKLTKEFAFSVCRIEPENNIHIILEAFVQLADYSILIIGNWESSKYGRLLKNKYSKYSNIFTVDATYNGEVIDQLRANCTWYIHGHSAGGTNPSLVEAMSHGCSIIAYDVSFNRYTTNSKALYFRSSSELIKTIKTISGNDLKSVSVSMKKIAIDNYTWNKVCNKYSDMFISILRYDTPPEAI